MKGLSAALLAGLIFAVSTVSAQEAAPAANQPEKLLYSALIGTAFSNGLLLAHNHFLRHFSYANVTMDTIRQNLVDDWIWDTDPFPTNHLAHPYHGSTYHAAARASGFNFYEAYVFDLLGSFTWEVFCESQRPARSDLINTSVSGAMLGEMLHRLYLEFNSPLGAIISPMDSFTHLISRRRPEKSSGKNLYLFKILAGGGWNYSAKYNIEDDKFLESWNTPTINFGLHIIYGNPYQESKVPYENFEMRSWGGLGTGWWDMGIVSDGYLFSFLPPLDNPADRLSTGLSLSYDFFTGPYQWLWPAESDRTVLNIHNQGLNWAFKYERRFAKDSRLELRAHAGWLAFGASFFFNDTPGRDDGVTTVYGTGADAKLLFSYIDSGSRRLDVDLMLYGMRTLSYYKPEMKGWELCGFLNIFYSFPLGKYWGLSIGDTIGGKAGIYETVPDIGQWAHSIRLFVEWKIFEK
jgi:hypothetical protein